MSETLNILLCEPSDNEAMRLIDHLGSYNVGCNVDTVVAVQEVPAVLANRQWDLVLCAHAESTFNARQILDIVRAADPDLPVIVLASEITEADGAALIIAGARDVMRKSDLSRLIPIVLREIESSRTRRELSRAVGRAELHFRNIVEASLQGIMVRVNSKTQFVNSAFCKMFGYSADELMNLRSMADLHPESERSRIQRHVEDRYSGDMSIYEYEIEGVRKDGSTFWCSKMASHVEWDGQRAVQIVIVDISERKKTEQQLAERERLYRETFENAPVALLRTNRDRNVIEANRAFADMLGYPAEEIIGRRIGEFAPRTDTTHVVPQIQKVWAREIDHLDTEHRMVRKDGREIWVQSSARLTPGSGEGENAVEMLAQFQDITRRHEAEISLQERETLYRVLVEKSLQGILIINQYAKPIFVNNVFAEMLGYTPDDILALDAGISLYHQEDRQEIRRRMGLRKTGDRSVQRYELRAIKKDGSTIWVDIMTTAIEWYGQRAVQVATIDITERKTSAHEIEEREKKYRQTFEHAPVALIRSGENRRIIEVNDAFADMLGYTKDEVIGLRVGDLAPPSDEDRVVPYVKQVWMRERERADVEHRLICKDGREIWVQRSCRLTPDHTGHSIQMLSQFQDITGRREAEIALQERETLYRNLVEKSLQGILIIDHAGQAVFVNNVFADALGYVPDEIMAMSETYHLYHPEDQSKLRRRMGSRKTGDDTTNRYEIRAVKKDGTTIWLEQLSTATEWNGQPAIQVAVIDITSRKNDAHLLEARELKYRQTFQNAPIAMFRIDRQRVFHDVNQAFIDLVRYSAEDLNGVAAYNLIHPDDAPTVRKRTMWVWNRRVERIENEYRMNRKDGSQIWVSSSGRLTPDETGELNHLIVQIQDITDRKKAEEQLRLAKDSLAVSEKQYREMFDNAPVAMLESTPDGYVRRTNVAFRSMLGYAAEEIVGMRTWDTIHPDQREYVRQRLGKVHHHPGGQTTTETPHVHKDGHTIWASVNVGLIRGEDGQPQHVIAQLQDITDRKKAEEQRDEALRSLKLREQQYRELFEHAPVAMASMSLDGKFLQTNQAYRDLLGYTEEEIMRLRPIDTVHLDQREHVRDHMTASARSSETLRFSNDRQLIRKDGTPIWVWLSGTRINDDDGKPSYMLTHLQDITARKRAEAQLFQSQKMEALGNLAGGIAHDFNNMLLPIIGLTALTKEDLPYDSPVQENLDTVIEAAENARRIVSQILTFSRQDQAAAASIAISPCIAEAVQLVRNILPSSITIIDEVKPDIGTVLADAAQLHSVVLNLGSNASHAMDGKVGSLAIGLDTVTADATMADSIHGLKAGITYARIHVRDTGSGMDKETLDKIFNPFFTTKPVGEGTGLGLSMVHGIIERFSGGIHVSSEVGVGTKFDIYLPMLDVGTSGHVNADSGALALT